ncbi:hypothetical protein Ntsu_78870 [Nocardia sp. IFM 10818]
MMGTLLGFTVVVALAAMCLAHGCAPADPLGNTAANRYRDHDRHGHGRPGATSGSPGGR